MKGELGGKINEEIVALRPKLYDYLKDENLVGQKPKGTRKCGSNGK